MAHDQVRYSRGIMERQARGTSYSREVWNYDDGVSGSVQGRHTGFTGCSCSLSLGHILQAKRELLELDLAFLASLRARAALSEDCEPLPEWAEQARIDNR